MKILITDNYLNPSNYKPHKNEKGYYQEVIKATKNLFSTMANKHNKVLPIRLDLTYPQYSDYPNDKVLLSRFIESLILHCKRKGLDPHYLWVREQASSKNHHYHVILLLNGNKIQNPHGVYNKATELWGKGLNTDAAGLVHYGTHIMIRRNAPDFEQTYHDALSLASYLAKAYSKGNAPKGAREMGMSNLKNRTNRKK